MISRNNRRGYVCSVQTRLSLLVQVLLAVNVCSTLGAEATQAPFNFSGTAFSAGSTAKASVPLSAQEKSLAAQGGNAVPPTAVAVLATPANFATQEQQYNVVGSIKRTGFQRVRIGTFHGGHEVNDAQTSIALRWFRELAK
jgi:hypothetical protein